MAKKRPPAKKSRPKNTRSSTRKKDLPGKKPSLARRHYKGPEEWFVPQMEEAYSRIRTKEEVEARPRRPARAAAKATKKGKGAAKLFASTIHEGEGESVLARLPRRYWQEQFAEFHKRRVAASKKGLAPGAPGVLTGMPAIPGQNNWTPIGPSVVARGQTNNRAPVTGRICGVAIAPGGMRMYVATAVGGVWRSDDAGLSWQSTMDGFDQNPTNFASTSLACGAIAINPTNPDRIYVGHRGRRYRRSVRFQNRQRLAGLSGYWSHSFR